MLKWHIMQQLAVSAGMLVSIPVVGCSSATDADQAGAQTTVSAIQSAPAGSAAAAGAPKVASDATAAPRVGDSLGRYRLFIPTRTKAETLARMQAVAKVLGERDVTVSAGANVSTQWTKPLSDSDLDVAYDAEHDVLQIKRAPADSYGDVGELAAREEMKRFVNDLANAGLIKSRQFEPELATTGHHKRITGTRRAQETTTRIIEYRYFVDRRIGGVQVANAPLVIGISPSGKRSSVRIGGVDVEAVEKAGKDQPGRTGSVFARAVAENDLDEKFASQVAPGRDKRVSWKGLVYRLPAGVRDAVVEPRMNYRFVIRHLTPEGETTLSDRSVASFSLTDRNAPHDVL